MRGFKTVLILANLSLAMVSFGFSLTVFGEVSEQMNEPLELLVRPNKKDGESAHKLFKNQLLELVLLKTQEKYGDFSIKEYPRKIKQGRVIAFIKQNEKFRIIATMDSPKRRKDVRPIEIPIYKGLFGYRIFIIRKEDQSLFSKIKTKEQLQALIAIQGHDWPDSDILEKAGFGLRRSPNYNGIFKMLRLKRGDYFPRGVHEPWQEIKRQKDRMLAIEESLLIQYNAPFYFFVGYQDRELYNRIEEGLLMVIKDGSFDELFYNHLEIKTIFEKAKIGNRKIFKINNDAISNGSKFNEGNWWYQIDDEKRYFLKNKPQAILN